MSSKGFLRSVFTAVLLGFAGCSKSPPPPVAEATPQDAAPAEAVGEVAVSPSPAPVPPPDVAGVRGLLPLTQKGVFPIVRNNAINALKAWDEKNYLEALTSMRMIMSLPEAAPYAAHLDGAFNEMLAALKPAAVGGNQSAKDALEYMQSLLAPR